MHLNTYNNICILVVQIVQPPADVHAITIIESTSSIQLMCTLNINIPSSVMVTWLHNDSDAMITSLYKVIKTGNTTTLVIGNPQPSDAGVYHCVFNDSIGMWTLKGNLCKDCH